MSGSPILQDGKLIGAVTHVMVNDPTRGYGVFIENMLNQMESSIKMASITAGMYEDMSTSISKIMNKMNMKKEKAASKKPQTSVTANSGRGMDMVKSIMAGNNQTSPRTTPPPSSAPANGDSGLDGLL